ncbi:MAG: homocysteine S-methyltransferase [Solobacterium sp.]|nr:homocysteine S-methyltransferase [Solobacterium sp.]
MKASLNEILEQNGIMIIDGSMSTALEHMGADLNNKLWTASILANQPELVKQVHLNYFRAGADCGITCSYQATIPGFMAQGYTEEEAEDLIRRSVELFLKARDEWWQEEGKDSGRPYPLCLGAVGPYGAYLADGSEYRGNYGLSDRELYVFHKRRMELLYEEGADILLIETQPSLQEVLVEARIAEELGAEFWISFSCLNGKQICDGTMIRDCAEALDPEKYPHLKMIGVNCTKPEYLVSLIKELKAGTSLPVAVYPNSGETYDPETKTWSGSGRSMDFGDYALQYMMAGADAVGGCCTTVEKHVQQVVEARKKYRSMKEPVLIRR